MNQIEQIQKKLKDKINTNITNITNQENITKDYLIDLENNPKYSLDVDPENKYDMSNQQKEFIKYYCEFKNLPAAASLANIDVDTARNYFTSYSTQQEIRRINKSLYHRQFSKKLLTVDEIGGYLSSLITDENIPISDRLKPIEKIQVAKILLDLNEMKNKAIDNPNIIINNNIENELKDLSVSTIKQLLSNSNKDELKAKDELIDKINIDDTLNIEEINMLRSLSTNELLTLINDINKENNNE